MQRFCRALGNSCPRPLWRLLQILGLWCMWVSTGIAAEICRHAVWPQWEQFAQRHMQPDGRVVDYSVPQQQSTSEGQAYALFIALVARDQERFDQIWAWSQLNLAGGDSGARLPAWQWGLRHDGTWVVLDSNPASDADLWFAYALFEAGRVWREPRYTRQAKALLAQVVAQEVAALPGLGPMLLPAPKGFVLKERLWRLNPSYLPLPLLRAFERVDGRGPWKAMVVAYERMLSESTPQGFVPDWVAYDVPEGAKRGTFVRDPEKGDLGSYDAIRAYLWAGMTPGSDKLAPLLRNRLGGMARALLKNPIPPEKVMASTGQVEGAGPVGFSAALLPYLHATGAKSILKVQQTRVQTQLLQASLSAMPPYYDQVLGLFALGWMEQRYRFLPEGRLQLRWEKACPPKSAIAKP